VSEQTHPGAGGRVMTLLGHLNELKDHLIRIALALVVCSAGTFAFATQVLRWLIRPVSGHEDKIVLMATTPTTAFSMYVKIALFSGAVVAMPFIVYQVLHYVLPGMTRREKRALLWIVPGATLLFACGAAFAYFVMIPPSLSFLFSFWVEFIDQMWTIEEYLSFVTGLVFWVGVSFEMPLLMAAVARLGVVTAQQMLAATRFAVVGIAVLAALITPTPDPLNMALVAGPLLGLYFVGIALAWAAQPRALRGPA
jgi:sec-independent protein translocase protein TatC